MSTPWVVLFIVLWLFVVAAGIALVGVSQRITRLEVGSSATTRGPADMGPVAGTKLDLSADLQRRLTPTALGDDVILLFLSSTCGPCRGLADDLRTDPPAFEHSEPGTKRAEVLLITDREGVDTYADLSFVGRIVAQENSSISTALGVGVSPYAMAVTEGALVVSAIVPGGRGDLERLEHELLHPSLDVTRGEADLAGAA